MVKAIFNEEQEMIGVTVDNGEIVYTLDLSMNVIDYYKVDGFEREQTII